MSTRQETYCDCCGKQMSKTKNGSTDVFGFKLRVLAPDTENYIDFASLSISVNEERDCGSSSFAKFMNKKDFCSTQCMLGTFTTWLSEVLAKSEGEK